MYCGIAIIHPPLHFFSPEFVILPPPSSSVVLTTKKKLFENDKFIRSPKALVAIELTVIALVKVPVTYVQSSS